MIKINGNISNVIFIGNGFDLNLGLNTSYVDFLKSKYFLDLLPKRKIIAEKLIEKNDNNYNWIDIEKDLKEISTSFSVNGKTEFDELKFGFD